MRLPKLTGFVVVLGCWASSAKAAMPKLQLRPAIPQGYAGEILRLRVTLPCGSKYYGLVALEDKKSGVLEVAAAVTEASFLCTSMPETVDVGVEFLATRSFKKIAPMAVNVGMRVATVPVEEVRLVASGVKRNLYAVYTRRCGRDLGTLVHRVGRHQLEVAMIEDVASRERTISCIAAPKPHHLTVLGHNGAFSVRPLPDRSKSLARVFTLQLAPVRSVSANGSALSLEYQRECNEAPLGVVLGSSASGEAHVGMLVARFPNVHCPDELAKPVWVRTAEAALNLPSQIALLPIAPAANEALQLSAPSSLNLAYRADRVVLHIEYIDSCSMPYAVYAHDAQGLLSVGVLSIDRAKLSAAVSGRACARSPNILSIVQPFVAVGVKADQVYPLRVRGL